jgi:hypothetical protein
MKSDKTLFWGLLLLILLEIILTLQLDHFSPLASKIILVSEVSVLILGIYGYCSHYSFHTVYCLILILATNVLLSSVYIFTTDFTALFGRDLHYDVFSTNAIINSGHWDPNAYTLAAHNAVHRWPILHLFGATMGIFIKLNYFFIAKFIPLFLKIIFILIFYLLIKEVFNDEKIALLSSFFIGFVPTILFFHSLYVRETMGYVLMFLVILFFLYFKKYRKSVFLVLLFVLMIICSLSHHLTYSFLVFFFILFLLVELYMLFKTKSYHSHFPTKTFFICLFAVVIFIANNIYNNRPFLSEIVLYSQYIFSTYNIVIDNIGTIPFYFLAKHITYLAFIGMFFLIIFYYFIRYRKKFSFYEIFFSIWSLFGLFLIISPYLTAINKMIFSIPRIDGFILPFVITFVCFISLKMNKKEINYIPILFCIFSILTIPTYVVNSQAAPDDLQTSMRYHSADYYANNWFSGSGTALGGEKTIEIFTGLGYKNVRYDNKIFEGKLAEIKKFNWIILMKEDFTLTYSLPIASKTLNNISYHTEQKMELSGNKIYNSDYIIVYKIL